MILLRHAASFAAALLALVGLTSLSAPGQAAALQATTETPTPAVLVVPALPVDLAAAAPAQAVDAPADAPLATTSNFASLGAALAAQESDAIDEATRCLAGAIYFEAKGEPVDGQLAVAEVIVNRAKSGRFPADVCGVVKQRGQFSFVRGGEIPDIDQGRASYRTAVAIAKVALASAWRSSAREALYFHARHEPMSGRAVRVAAIGNHIFYR